MEIILPGFLALILIVGVIIFVFIVGRGRTGSVLNVEKFRTAWLSIEQQLQRENQSSYQISIINGDKLLDSALKQRGFKGDTMGERMKSAQQSWQNANVVWSAHKLRNRVAHEDNLVLSYEETRSALAGFKQGLKDLGAI